VCGGLTGSGNLTAAVAVNQNLWRRNAALSHSYRRRARLAGAVTRSDMICSVRGRNNSVAPRVIILVISSHRNRNAEVAGAYGVAHSISVHQWRIRGMACCIGVACGGEDALDLSVN